MRCYGIESRIFRTNGLTVFYQTHDLLECFSLHRTTNIVPIEEVPFYKKACEVIYRRSGWTKPFVPFKIPSEYSKLCTKLQDKLISKKELSKAEEVQLYRLFQFTDKVAILDREAGIMRKALYGWIETFLPNYPFDTTVSSDEALDWLILKIINSLSACSVNEVAFWLGDKVTPIKEQLAMLEKTDKIRKIAIKGITTQKKPYWISPRLDETWQTILDKNLPPMEQPALLTPLDNLVRNRKWLKTIFNYDFKMEYFVVKGMKWQLSLLHRNAFWGYINSKYDRKRKTFLIKGIVPVQKIEAPVCDALMERIVAFARFHGAETLTIASLPPDILKYLPPIIETSLPI